jgi:hypothetical protein
VQGAKISLTAFCFLEKGGIPADKICRSSSEKAIPIISKNYFPGSDRLIKQLISRGI